MVKLIGRRVARRYWKMRERGITRKRAFYLIAYELKKSGCEISDKTIERIIKIFSSEHLSNS